MIVTKTLSVTFEVRLTVTMSDKESIDSDKKQFQ